MVEACKLCGAVTTNTNKVCPLCQDTLKMRNELYEVKEDQLTVAYNKKTCYHCQSYNICLVFAKLRDVLDVLPRVGIGGGSSEMMAIMGMVQRNCNKFVGYSDDED
jgi:hypothetical protein